MIPPRVSLLMLKRMVMGFGQFTQDCLISCGQEVFKRCREIRIIHKHCLANLRSPYTGNVYLALRKPAFANAPLISLMQGNLISLPRIIIEANELDQSLSFIVLPRDTNCDLSRCI